MTEIEKKALALVNEVLAEWGVLKNAVEVPKNSDAFARALLRAIEQHEADKAAHAATVEGILKAHEAYKREVSDAVEHCRACSDPEAWTRIKFELDRFIIPKPDPLVEALNALPNVCCEDEFDADDAAKLREALAKRGFKIVEDV